MYLSNLFVESVFIFYSVNSSLYSFMLLACLWAYSEIIYGDYVWSELPSIRPQNVTVDEVSYTPFIRLISHVFE